LIDPKNQRDDLTPVQMKSIVTSSNQVRASLSQFARIGPVPLLFGGGDLEFGRELAAGHRRFLQRRLCHD
jgi:hypothetical protein